MIYIIQSGENGPLKIGSSSRIYHRLSALRQGNPDELFVRAILPNRDSLEQRLHRVFKPLHRRGEWFNVEEPLVSFLNAVVEIPEEQKSLDLIENGGSSDEIEEELSGIDIDEVLEMAKMPLSPRRDTHVTFKEKPILPAKRSVNVEGILMQADRVGAERVGEMYDYWKEGYNYGELSEFYKVSPSAISQLFRKYYPDVNFKAEGLKRSQEMRGCLTREEKLNLVRPCKCGICGEFIPQFVERDDGKIVKSERLYIKGHR